MAREVFFPNPQNKPVGYSPATRVGNSVFVAGQVSVDANGNLVGKGDSGAQARQCFENVEAALRSAGASWEDVTKLTAFLVDAADFSNYAEARQRLFPQDGPASSTIIVKALVKPEYLVEIEALAVVG